MLIRIPRVFFDDHRDRELDTPAVVRKTASHYFIESDDPAIPELIDDAKFYAHPYGPDAAPPGLKGAAKALLKALV